MVDFEGVLQAAQLLSDPLRLHIVTLLMEGPVTVNELTVRTGAPQPRVSSHLALLRQAGWAQTSPYGQQRRYELASPRIAEFLYTLAAIQLTPSPLGPTVRVRSRTAQSETIRVARTCYKHLAGQAGVALCNSLRDKGWIVPVKNEVGSYQPGFSLTAPGRTELLALGIVIPMEVPRKPIGYACPDWKEPEPHLGGALGQALLNRLVELGLVQHVGGTRAVAIKGDLATWLEEGSVK